MTATDDWLASMNGAAAAKAAIPLSLDARSPDDLARQADIARQLGVPPIVVGSDPDAFKARAQQKAMTDALVGAPKTAAWLSNRDNGGLAKDDVAGLSWFEKGLKDFAAIGNTALTRGIERGIASGLASNKGFRAIGQGLTAADIGKTEAQMIADEIAKLGPDPAPESIQIATDIARFNHASVAGLTETDRAAMLKSAGALLQEARAALTEAQAIPGSATGKAFVEGAWARAPDTLGGIVGAFAEDPLGALAFLGDTVAESLPMMVPAALATLATRNPMAGAGVMGATSFAAEASAEAMDFLAQNNIRLETPEDAAALMANADLMQEAQRRGLGKGIIIGALDAVSGGVAGQALAKSRIGDLVLQSFAQAGLGASGEALGELAIGDEVSWKQVIVEGLAEFVTAPVEMLSMGRNWIKDRSQAAASAGGTAERLAAVDEAAGASKLKTRSPESFENALGNIMDGTLYVPADDLNTFFQAKDIGFADWDIDPDTFAEQLASGGKVAIPESVYAARISGTPDADWFRQNATTSPDEMSLSEAERFNEEVRAVMEDALREAEQARLEAMDLRASVVQVLDQVYTQLREAGQTRDVATANAQVLTAAINTLASRTGQDALDMARRFGLAIKGPEDEPMRRRGNLDIALNTLRSGKVPKPGPSLTDFVVSSGGIQDVGGDLAAMDLPKGTIAETREEVTARKSQPSMLGLPSVGKGMGLDEMARAARDAGYFPGAQDNADGTAADLVEALKDALRREAAGEKVYIPGQEGDKDLAALADELGRRGIDLNASNDEIAAKLEDGGNTLSQEKRASITFPEGGIENGTSVIKLFETSDLSSFQHETGHYLLEVFTVLAADPTAPQDVKDDMAAIRDYLGMEGKPTVAQHEVWARTWEAYLMEGKAPTLGLMDAFARFKSWLVRIYQTARGLNVKISPEIRDVMDRILATESEITATRAEQAMKPLFTDEVAAGMSPAAFKTYQRMARRATEQAEADLLAKTMAAVRRQKEAWWKAEYKAVMGEVTKTVNSQREYRLTEMLANQRWLADTPKEVPDIQLNRKELVDTFGAGVLAELSREKLGGKRAIYGGAASLHEVSELFGFANPQDMIRVLQNAGKRLDAIRDEAERVMRERYGDPLTDGSIESEALEAIHSEQQAQTVASEARHLAARSGLPVRNLTAQVFRQRARLMLGRMSVAEAAKPDAFLAAERQAARRAEDAFAKVTRGKDSEEALVAATRHKEQQLLNHYLYLESRDLAKEVASGREKMRAYDKASVRQKLEGGYIEQIDTLLDQYDFRVRSKRQIAKAESLTAFVQRMTDEGRAGQLSIDPRVMAQAKKVHYTRLSVDELRGLFDTIANIDHLGRFKQKLIDAAEQRDLDAVVAGVIGSFDANVPPNPPSRTPDAGERAARKGRDFLNSVLNADTLLREIDGQKDMGPAWMAMKQDIDKAMFRLTERRKAMAASFDAIYSVYSASEKAAMAQKKANTALGIPMAKWDLIALALNTGNLDNWERITNPKAPGHFDAGGIEAALAELDARDWGVVQGTWDYINSFWPEIAAKEKRQTGVAPIKVDAKIMVNAPGNVAGGYYPIKYDTRLSGLTADFNQKDIADAMMGGSFGKAQTRNGHTKARAQTSRQAVALDLAVGHMHVEQVLYDLEIGEPVANSWKVLHDNRLREAFTNAGKQADFEALEVWQQDVASGDRASAGGVQSALRALRTGFTISRLAFNLSTALIQPSGLVQSAVVIGKGAVAKGTIAYMQNPARWVREVTAVSSLMRERKTTFERDIHNALGDLALSHDGTSWVSKKANWISPVLGQAVAGSAIRWQQFQRNVILPLSFWMMQSTQFYVVDMPTWVSAYQKELGASKNEQKARDYADMITKRAQGSGLISDRGALERGTLNRNSRQQEFPKLLTALGSYMFAKGNIAYERTMATNFKDPVQVMSLAADYALLFTLEATLYAAVKGGLPGEDDDEPEDWAAWLAKQTMFSAMSTVPLFREFAGTLQGYGGGGVIGSAIETLSRPFVQAGQGEYDKSAVKAFMDAGGVLLHLPSAQTKMVVDGLFEQDMSLRSDPDIGTAVLGSGRGRTLADVMFGDAQ